MTLFRRYRNSQRRGRHAAVIAGAVVVGMLLAPGAVLADSSQSSASNSTAASANGSQGIIEINQDAGDFNNQGNVVAIALTAAGNSAALAKLMMDAEQGGAVSTNAPSVQTNSIVDSFNNTSGIAQVNQTTGQANVQLNAIAIAFAANALFPPAMTDVELRGVAAPVFNAGASSAAPGSVNVVSNSFNNFRGIAQVQQIAGDSNIVVNVVAVAMAPGGG
jgi:hypothetical protein